MYLFLPKTKRRESGMKSNPFKRVLSFMLVLSMVLGLMPGISYEAAQAASTP